MRQRNGYGLAGTLDTGGRKPQQVPGARRPVTRRGRMILEQSRRRFVQRY